MSSQPLLFATGMPGLPPRVTVFASGANEAREIRGFALAGVAIGVSASLIREASIRELLNAPGHVFADSGAFSEVAIGLEGPKVVAPISDREWKRRIAVYRRLAVALGSRLSVVAPDRVADQQTTLERLFRYRTAMNELAGLGAEILIPVQNGDLSPIEFYREAVATAGLTLVPAMPMKKAASSFTDVLEFVRVIRPARLHLLGMGYERAKARTLVARLQMIAPEIVISMDSNRLRAVTGKGRVMTEAEKRMRAEEPEGVFSEVESEALHGAGYRLDYTDAIAFPSSWATTEQLKSIALAVGLASTAWPAFLTNPEGFLQREVEGMEDVVYYELPHVAQALDVAWQQYVKAEHDRAVRTAAVRTTFQLSRIATPTRL